MDNRTLNLEHEIASFISKDNGATVHFEYKPKMTSNVVSAFTVNSGTKESFLLKTEEAKTKEEALEKILAYVKELKGMSSFTVIWMKVGTHKTETSYFYCHDVIDVVNKFFAKKDSVDYVIFEIKLNPIA